ncbi:MAG: helix-turn-helix domain-containing protein [Tenacibaculum sp.]
MPIFLVQHITNNATTTNLALSFYFSLQNLHYSKCINCWVDDYKNSVFYLLKATNKDAIQLLYNNTSTTKPYKITPVNNNLVYAFLNSKKQLKNTLENTHSSQNTLLIKVATKTTHPQQKMAIFKQKTLTIIKERTYCYNGKIKNETNNYLFLSFSSTKCINNFLQAINNKLKEYQHFNLLELKSIIYNNKSFKEQQDLIQIANLIKNNDVLYLSEKQEFFLINLLSILKNNYNNTELNLKQFCKKMMMSKTKLYRYCKTYTGKSINEILKDYRLNRALDKVKTKKTSINQIATDSGFNSNSYFSNCFKKKFGISPSTLLKFDEKRLKNQFI